MEEKKKVSSGLNPEDVIGKNAYTYSLFEIDLFSRSDRDKVIEYMDMIAEAASRKGVDTNDDNFRTALILFSRLSNETIIFPKIEKKPGIA